MNLDHEPNLGTNTLYPFLLLSYLTKPLGSKGESKVNVKSKPPVIHKKTAFTPSLFMSSQYPLLHL